MSTNNQTSPQSSKVGEKCRPPDLVSVILALGALAGLILSFLFVSYKAFSVDEFMLAHGAWLVLQGKIPYRDFFFHNSPLSLYYFSLGFVPDSQHPLSIQNLRLLTYPFVLIIAYCSTRMSGPGIKSALVIILLCCSTPFVDLGAEIRRDTPALAFYLLALMMVMREGANERRTNFLAGFFLALCIWTCEKGIIYTLPLSALGLHSLLRPRREIEGMLKKPYWFLAGGLVPTLSILTYLALTNSIQAWVKWSINWPLFRVLSDRPDRGTYYLQYYAYTNWWILIFSLIGISASLMAIKKLSPRSKSFATLLFSSMVMALLSFKSYNAPYPYSLLPFHAFVCLYASRGVLVFCQRISSLSHGRTTVQCGSVLLALYIAWHTFYDLRTRYLHKDTYYKKVAETLHSLTNPRDCIFDSSGSYVSRPDVGYFYWSDLTAKKVFGSALAKELMRGIEENDCSALLFDFRISQFPKFFLEYISQHYVPYLPDLGIWGQRFVTKDHLLESNFLAVRSATYFVSPKELLDHAELSIDGVKIDQEIFELSKGQHVVEARSKDRELTFSIIWLPRNTKPFVPLEKFKVTFSDSVIPPW